MITTHPLRSLIALAPHGGTGYRFPGVARLVLGLGLVFLLSGCSAAVNWNYPRTPSTAFDQPQATTLGGLFQEVADQQPGLSGFSVVREGERAFVARLAMADLAERSLDAQYYIWDGDMTGQILADRLIRAADRGVHVRVLIDDHYLTEVRDFRLAALDAYPNIEVRFFNPVTSRGWRTLSSFREFGRVNHRMHNKLLVVDNAVAVVGGRNIGDVYFGVRADHDYRDLDVLTAGPIVRELSDAFDLFWNSEWAIPVGAVVGKVPSEQEVQALRSQLEANVAKVGYPYPIYESVTDLRALLVQIRDKFIWAPGHVLVENPSRVRAAVATGVIATALAQRVREVQHEVLIESPYFVLGEPTIEKVRQLTARGVRVRALTNSALSHDVLPALAGYVSRRKQLLRAGMELYELRPDSNMKRQWSVLAGSAKAALHAKTLVFDRQSVFIGSFNLDPRSATLNTEMGVMIDSVEIASKVAESMDEGVAAGSAYHVTLDQNNDLLWTTQENGQAVEYRKDPGTDAWHRFVIGVVGLLPIEGQL
jgi:putative cardiolipin synthase